jgi:hypothetical protein
MVRRGHDNDRQAELLPMSFARQTLPGGRSKDFPTARRYRSLDLCPSDVSLFRSLSP